MTAAEPPIGRAQLVEVLSVLAEAIPVSGRAPDVPTIAGQLYRTAYRSGGHRAAGALAGDPRAEEWLLRRFRTPPGLCGWHQHGSFLVSNRRPLGTRVVRFYWNLAGQSPLGFLPRAAAAARALGVPFTLKCVPRPSWRADRVVLYVPCAAYEDVRDALWPLTATAVRALRWPVPLCTHRLAPGWATAEDPIGDLSFGEDRCLLIAEVLWRAAQRGARAPEALDAVASEVFSARGVSLEAPHLARFATSDYTLTGRGARLRAPPSERDGVHAPGCSSVDPQRDGADLLRTAVTLAQTLAARGLWSGDRCTWLVSVDSGEHCTAASVTRTVGPELYGGLSGIALALARVAAATGEQKLARAARGAARQALARAGDVSPSHRLGFFAGWSGIAAAVGEVGRILADDELLDSGPRLLRRLHTAAPPRTGGRDLVGGSAGAVLAIAGLPELRSQAWALGWATDLVDMLDRPPPSGRDGGGPAGMAHGLAGEALAVLELGAALRDESVLRRGAELVRLASAKAPAEASWCRGATGRALLHLRLFRHAGGDEGRTRAAASLETALRLARARLLRPPASDGFSLCHGVGGIADILLQAEQVFGELSLRSAACTLVEQIRAQPNASVGEGPGLFTGLAGAVLLYLRLHDPSLATTPFLGPAPDPQQPWWGKQCRLANSQDNSP